MSHPLCCLLPECTVRHWLCVLHRKLDRDLKRIQLRSVWQACLKNIIKLKLIIYEACTKLDIILLNSDPKIFSTLTSCQQMWDLFSLNKQISSMLKKIHIQTDRLAAWETCCVKLECHTLIQQSQSKALV